MRTPVFLIRYGDMVRELTKGKMRYDAVFGYTEQYDYALPDDAVVFGKRDRLAREKIGKRIYYTFPYLYSKKGKLKRRVLRIIGEIYELLLLIWYRPKVVVVVGAPIDMIFPFIYTKIFGVPLIAVFHDEVLAERLSSKIAAKIVNKPNVIPITNGELPRDQLISLGADPEKIIIHRVYYPPEFFVEKPIEPQIANSDKFKVFYIGRFAWTKGMTDLPEIIRLTHSKLGDKVKFYLVGDGPMVDYVKNKIAEYSLEKTVEFLGPRPSDMIYSYIRAADVVIVPSFVECFGKIAAEIMISGRPVVAYATGGLKYQITDGVDGFLVPTGDYKSMAQRIVELYENPQLRKKIAQNAAKVRKKYEDINQTLGYILKREIDRILAGSD